MKLILFILELFKLQRNQMFVSGDLWPLPDQKPASSLHQFQNKSAEVQVSPSSSACSSRAAERTRVLLEVWRRCNMSSAAPPQRAPSVTSPRRPGNYSSDWKRQRYLMRTLPGTNELSFAPRRIPNPLSRPGGRLISGSRQIKGRAARLSHPLIPSKQQRGDNTLTFIRFYYPQAHSQLLLSTKLMRWNQTSFSLFQINWTTEKFCLLMFFSCKPFL